MRLERGSFARLAQMLNHTTVTTSSTIGSASNAAISMQHTRDHLALNANQCNDVRCRCRRR